MHRNVEMIKLEHDLCCCPWSHGLRPKKLSVSVAVSPAPVRVPSQRPLAPSVASVTEHDLYYSIQPLFSIQNLVSAVNWITNTFPAEKKMLKVVSD